MGVFAAIMAFVSIASTLFSVGYSISQSQEQNKLDNKNIDLAKKNLELNETTSQKNFDLAKEQFEYQKQLNQTQMYREDTAFQRQIADLKASGLSPLMVAGNGASSSPLTSATAPQMDMSGINQAFQNMLGSYNDAFNRKLQQRQFALQSKTQTAQLYADLMDSYVQQKKSKLDMQYINEKLKWEKEHGFRDYDWKSDLTKLAEEILSGKKSTESIIPGISKDQIEEVKDLLDATADDQDDFGTYGSLSRNNKYSHMLDSENYDNDRSTFKLIGQEFNEKKQKLDLKIKDTEDNRKNLYQVDDYLKKHISLENWIKADNDFVKYYLKKGQFEGHKKYFD